MTLSTTMSRSAPGRAWSRRAVGALLVAATVLGACGRNASPVASRAAPAGAGPDLFVNTATGSDVRITGRLSIVALEALDRTLTADLLAGDPEIKLSDPFGEFTGPRLLPAPPGTYVALHLLFASDELIGLMPDQSQVVIKLPRRDFRLPLARDFVIAAGPQNWVSLHHDGPIDLVNSGGGLTWTPNWQAKVAEVELVTGGEVRVLTFDRARHLVDGELISMGDLPVVLDLHRADELRRNGVRLGADEFFAEIRAQEKLKVDGWLDSWRNVRVFAASIDPLGPPLSEVRGQILELDAVNAKVLLQVFEVRKDIYGLPAARPLRLSVGVGPETSIKWEPRAGAPPGQLTFSALQVGMLVGVAWEGPAPDGVLTARTIDIHSLGRQETPITVTGLITSVDLALNRFVLSASGQTAFRIGESRYITLTVDVDQRTMLTRRVDGESREFTLPDLPRGVRATVCFVPLLGDHVSARLVRLE